ncbi:hypothetical protein JCM10212_007080 [Sporobolomyces blumeae]
MQPGSVTFPPARPRSAPVHRPGPHRGNSASRPTPYQRPSTGQAPAADGKWQHDLFGAGSNLYRPAINVDHLRKVIPGAQPVESASLRPFGAATPAPQRLITTSNDSLASASASASAPATTTSPFAAAATQSAGGDKTSATLATRMGIKGVSNEAQERARAQKAERLKLERERRELLRARKALEKERLELVKIAEQEETGFVVQVEGLIYGTSGEDVQTAFGSYGEIKFCYVVNEKTAKESDELTARLTFSRHEDAATACHKLDGAIADGRPLRVRQVPRSPFPPALPPLPASISSSSAPSSPALSPVAGRGTRPSTRPRGAAPRNAAPQAAAPPPPPPIPSKMYADEIESSYAPVASASGYPALGSTAAAQGSSDAMDVEMDDAPAIPTGPRHGTAAGRARGRGRGGPGGAATRAVGPGVVAPPALLRPLPSQPAPSLLARVGGAGGNGGVPSAAGRGKGKPGAAPSLAQRLSGGGAPSLLSRLK